MKFDDLAYSFSSPEPGLEMKVEKSAKLYAPTSRAFEVNFPHDSVESRIINYLDEQPSSLVELLNFLRSNFDEYYKTSIAKEKIRQMMLDGLLTFADEDEGDENETVPDLEFGDEDQPNPEDYLDSGALDDYRRSYGHI